jgi:hypothetical protein
MQKTICLLTAFLWISMAYSVAFAADSDLSKELSDMKTSLDLSAMVEVNRKIHLRQGQRVQGP